MITLRRAQGKTPPHLAKASSCRMIMEMPQEFLTIKEASVRYRKSEVTIRRIIRDIVRKSSHKDRLYIKPAIREKQKLIRKRQPFAYTISTYLLDRLYGMAAKPIPEKRGEEEPREADDQGNAALAIFRRITANLEEQLRVKDGQIHSLNQALDNLSERQRETNILMKGLQERLLLAAPKKRRFFFF